jgi:hypothetical protein
MRGAHRGGLFANPCVRQGHCKVNVILQERLCEIEATTPCDRDIKTANRSCYQCFQRWGRVMPHIRENKRNKDVSMQGIIGRCRFLRHRHVICVIAIVFLLTFFFILSRYRKCPSDKIMVIYGNVVRQRGSALSAKCIHVVLHLNGRSSILRVP